MSFYDNLIRKFVKSESFGVLLNYYHGQEQINTKNYENYTKESYKKNPYAYTAIKIISRCFARVDWLVYTKQINKHDKRDEIENHPLSILLNNPNKYESGYQLRLKWITDLLLTGNVYMEKVSLMTGQDKRPKELYLLRPDRVTITPGLTRDEYIKNYIYRLGGMEYIYTPDKIRHTKFYDPLDDFYGMSPIEASASSIDLNNLARDWNKATLNGGGQPSMVLSSKGNLTKEQKDRLEARMREKANSQKGVPWVLEGGLDMKEMQMSAIDMAWVDASKLSAREICIVYGVPPEIMGDSANKTYNNYKESRKALYEETIIPYLEMYRDELNSWLTPLFGDNVMLDYDAASIEALQEDAEVLWKQAQNSDFITIDEKRNLLGYDDLKDGKGDVILVPINKVPLNIEEIDQTDIETELNDSDLMVDDEQNNTTKKS